MKKLLTFFAVATLAATVMAVPARRGTRTVKNSDGTSLTISLAGDETFHYYVTSEGVAVRQNEQGDWVPDLRDVKSLWAKASARRNVHRARLAKTASRSKAPLRAGESASATKKGLLILVNFQDVKFKNSDSKTKEIFTQMLNGIGNPYGRNHGSVREYFRAQSYGQFDIEFDIAGPVTVSGKMADYGANNSSGDDVAPGKMVAEAVNKVDADINFKDYDWDGDGEVENIYVTYAGFGEAVNGADPNTIWPHQWQLSDYDNYGSSLKKDGVIVDTYACGSELMGISGSTIDGIGTMCHEYSHCLGLPDFYDSYQKNFGMDSWSLMDYGCYNGDGFCPAGYTAYERWFSGWLEPIELSSHAEITDMPNIEQNATAYVVYNDANHNEYYLLENHQLVDWDKSAEGHGMLVVHVDYDENAWYNNTVNDIATRQRMTIIPADGKTTGTTLSDDPYPTKKNNELTDESSPAAKLYRANTDGSRLMHKPITDITETNGLISFSFMAQSSTLEVPVPEEDIAKLDVTKNTFTAKWSAVDGAASYNLRLMEKEETGGGSTADEVLEALIFVEDFESFFVDEGKTSDGSAELSSKISSYTAEPGWDAYSVYQGVFGAKLGTGSKAGFLTTPKVSCSTGELTVYVEAWDWFNYSTYSTTEVYKPDGSNVEVSLLDEDGKELQSETVAAADLFEGVFLPCFHFSNVPETFKIKISCTAIKKRLYISYLLIFDGNFTDDEVDSVWVDEDDAEAPQRSVQLYGAPKRIRRVADNINPNLAPGDVQTLTGITDTYYTFRDLTPGATYTWQVQAVAEDGSVSAWSKTVSVTLPEDGEDGIILIPSPSSKGEGEAYGGAGSIYNLAGQRLGNSPLKRGIYIIDGKKIIIQ